MNSRARSNIGKLIVSLGVVLVIVGLGIWLFGNKLGWLGNLPGDIKIERPGFTVYFPVTTMVLISITLSAVMWLIGTITRLVRGYGIGTNRARSPSTHTNLDFL